MRHGLAIVIASVLLVIGSQTRVAAGSGSLSQGSQDSQYQPRVQADIGSLGAVTVDTGSSFDLRVLAAGMASDHAVAVKPHDDKDKDKDKDKDHGKHGSHGRHRGHHWGRGGHDSGNDPIGSPSSPTPEPGTLLLTGIVAASAGLRARRARRSR